jgi:hypothetical protein
MSAMKSLIILLFWLPMAFGSTINGSFPPPKDIYIPILDAYSFDLDGDGTDEILTTSLNTRDRKATGPIAVYKYVGNGKFVDATQLFFNQVPQFFHARHVLFIPNFKAKHPAIFVSDHGVDLPPFDGGVSRLFVWDKSIKKYVDNTDKYGLADARAFSFSSTFTRLKNGEFALFKANISLPNSGPEFFIQDKNDHFKNIITTQVKFPKNKCFMNALFADFDQDGIDELFLGGCDMGVLQDNFLESDLVMKLDHKKLKPWKTLYRRNDEPLWGVSAVYAERLFNSNSHQSPLDLATVIYNPTFTRGKINFYKNNGSDLSFTGQFIPAGMKRDFFIPWIQVLDLDGDNKPEIIGVYRYGPERPQELVSVAKYFILKSDGKHFSETRMRLNVREEETFVNALKLKIKGIQHLAFPTYNGTIYILDTLPLK